MGIGEPYCSYKECNIYERFVINITIGLHQGCNAQKDRADVGGASFGQEHCPAITNNHYWNNHNTTVSTTATSRATAATTTAATTTTTVLPAATTAADDDYRSRYHTQSF